MALLLPSEYDASYFDGADQPLQHNAGYSRYRRWYRFEGEGSTGEFWKDKASNWLNHLAISGKKVLELACAKGFMVADLRSAGVDAYGLDISQYAIDNCESGISDYVSVGNATDLSQYANKEFDIIISFRLLECLSDADINLVLNECKLKGKRQIHIIHLGSNPEFYQQYTLQEWVDNFEWPKGTIIAPYNDDLNYIIK